jgi:ribonuclease HI
MMSGVSARHIKRPALYNKTMSDITIYIDGGSRGNPGPAGIGTVIIDENKKTVKEYSQYLGQATNNEAEYQALIFALKKTKSLFGKDKIKKYSINIFSDSELLVNQMTGRYKIINPKIQPLFLKAWNLIIDCGQVSFQPLSREKNKQADSLVNQALDQEGRKQRLI